METGRTVVGYGVVKLSFLGFQRGRSAPYSLCYRQGAGLVSLRALCALCKVQLGSGQFARVGGCAIAK